MHHCQSELAMSYTYISPIHHVPYTLLNSHCCEWCVYGVQHSDPWQEMLGLYIVSPYSPFEFSAWHTVHHHVYPIDVHHTTDSMSLPSNTPRAYIMYMSTITSSYTVNKGHACYVNGIIYSIHYYYYYHVYIGMMQLNVYPSPTISSSPI